MFSTAAISIGLYSFASSKPSSCPQPNDVARSGSHTARTVARVAAVKGQPPPTINLSLDGTVGEYTRDRLRQHTLDSYAGVPLSKFPEDLRAYEHLLWSSDAELVIELGVQFGASSLWFRDRLKAFARYRQPQQSSKPLVIGVDLDLSHARRYLAQTDPEYEVDIKLIEGSVTDPALPDRVAELIPPGSRCLVIEDSGHTYETTLASLRGFSRFVPQNGFLVVEDGCVDIEELRIDPQWPRGVLPAIHDWLEGDGAEFKVRTDLQYYGVTCHPGGFLERTG